MSVEVSELANGLTVASDSMPGLSTVTLGAWVSAGTRHEAANVNGIAHLLEHMAFKGTKRRSAFQIAQEIEAVGGYLNAYTGREVTAYYAKILAGDLELGMDIIGDILQHPVFAESELALERDVVLQEIGQAQDTPDDIIFDHFQETAFPNQPLGRPVLGDAATVSRLDASNLRDYLAHNYGSSRMVLAAAGSLNHEDLIALASRIFDSLPSDQENAFEPARYEGGCFSEERDLEQAHLLLGFPGASLLDDDFYAAGLFSTLLGGGMSSRLFQEVREKRGLAYSIYSFHSGFLDGGLFGIYAGTGQDRIGELVSVVGNELRGLQDHVDLEELDRVKAQTRAAYLMSRENTTARCEQLAQQILTYRRPIAESEMLQRIEKVSLSEVRYQCEKLTDAIPTMVAVGPVASVGKFEDTVRSLL
ncbi:MAG: pitrilysin family protein [Kiloniellales bacterium]|nr:pitrilysin family protein [Kiloniellales bacterium]